MRSSSPRLTRCPPHTCACCCFTTFLFLLLLQAGTIRFVFLCEKWSRMWQWTIHCIWGALHNKEVLGAEKLSDTFAPLGSIWKWQWCHPQHLIKIHTFNLHNHLRSIIIKFDSVKMPRYSKLFVSLAWQTFVKFISKDVNTGETHVPPEGLYKFPCQIFEAKHL